MFLKNAWSTFQYSVDLRLCTMAKRSRSKPQPRRYFHTPARHAHIENWSCCTKWARAVGRIQAYISLYRSAQVMSNEGRSIPATEADATLLQSCCEAMSGLLNELDYFRASFNRMTRCGTCACRAIMTREEITNPSFLARFTGQGSFKVFAIHPTYL